MRGMQFVDGNYRVIEFDDSVERYWVGDIVGVPSKQVEIGYFSQSAAAAQYGNDVISRAPTGRRRMLILADTAPKGLDVPDRSGWREGVHSLSRALGGHK